MKQTTRIAIAALLHSAGSVLTALAAEFNGDDKPQETTATPEPKRGRGKAAAAAQPETPAEPAAPAQPEPTVTGKTYEDMKRVIKPLVEAGRGAEVRAAIAGFAPTLREMDPKHYEAFQAAIVNLENGAKTEEY